MYHEKAEMGKAGLQGVCVFVKERKWMLGK